MKAGKNELAILFVGSILVVLILFYPGNAASPRVDKLVAKAKDKDCFVFTDWHRDNPLTEQDVPHALAYVKSHRDYTSYFILLVLRAHYLDAYKKLGKEVRASILISALENAHSLNDWSILDSKDPFDKESAKALLETGKVALEHLKPLLENNQPALLEGSQAATASITNKYRRKDFAYRYISLIMGRSPAFDADPRRRDKHIDDLKRSLSEHKD
jgi:hypothetical protein